MQGTKVARVTYPVQVRVRLGEVGCRGTVVAGVSHSVPVGVLLPGVVGGGTVVGAGASTIPIPIIPGILGAPVTDVSQSVAVAVLLERIRDVGAIVQLARVQREARIPLPVPVGIRANVACVPRSIPIGIFLTRIVSGGTVIEGIRNPVVISVTVDVQGGRNGHRGPGRIVARHLD